MTRLRKLFVVVALVGAGLQVFVGCSQLESIIGLAPPPVPTGLAVGSPTSSTLTVTWTTSSGATGYQVFRDKNVAGSFGTRVYDGLGTDFTDNGLKSGTTYYYKVRGSNSAGGSALSEAVSGVTRGATGGATPAQPTGLSVSDVTSSSMKITWTGVTGATSYQLYRASSADVTFTNKIHSGASTSYTGTGLDPNTTRYYAVQATNSAGSGPLSDVLEVTTAPLTPAGLAVGNPTMTTLDVSWTAPAGGASGYQVRRGTSESGPFAGTYSGSATKFTDSKLNANTTYYYEVAAYNVTTGIFSAPVSGKTSMPVPGTIVTVAGNGTRGYSGDGGAATSAEFGGARGLAVDTEGNLYIADSGNYRVRRVDPSGVITTVAGNGTSGYAGDNGAATSAELGAVQWVAVDSLGNLFISDNRRIRKVDTSGIITTVVGTGTSGFAGDGGPASAAELGYATGIAVDSVGNLYIADYSNHRIRKVDHDTGIISTVVGVGTKGLSGDGGLAVNAEIGDPISVAVDSSGNLYFVANYRVRKVDTSGILTTVAGTGTLGYSGDGGQGALAQLDQPQNVAVDSSGNVYISDTNNQRVRKIDSSGIITTFAGNGVLGYSGDNGPAKHAELNLPFGIATDAAGDLYISCGAAAKPSGSGLVYIREVVH